MARHRCHYALVVLTHAVLFSAVVGANRVGVDPYACDLRFRVNGGAAHSVPVASAASAAGGRALAARIADAAAAARVDEFSVCASALAGRAEAVAADPVAVYSWPPRHSGVWKRPDVFVVHVSAASFFAASRSPGGDAIFPGRTAFYGALETSGFVAAAAPPLGATGHKIGDALVGAWPVRADVASPPRAGLIICSVIDDASGVSRLAGFVAHHTALGVAAFHFYDIASVPLTEAAWAALRRRAGGSVTITRPPDGLRTPVAAYQTCARVHGTHDAAWVTFLALEERLVMPPGATLSQLDSVPSVSSISMPVYCGLCDSGFRSTRSEATCWPHVRTLSRARRTSIQSVRLPCVGASTELSVTTERLNAHVWPCICIQEAHECAGAFVDDEAGSDATLFVCREPPPSGAVPPPPPPPLFPPPDGALCPDSITDVSVVCEVPRQPRALPPLVPQRRGQVNEAWHVVAARGTRAPRLAYVTMVYGPDVAWITERLHFTLASLRRVGASADIIVFVPDAAWADALSRALSVVPRVSVRVIDFVQPPLACRESVVSDKVQKYGSYEYWAPTYMQLAAFALPSYDAVVFLDALDVLVRESIDGALSEFARGSASFGATGEWQLGPGAPFNAGVVFLRPSRALYGWLDHAGTLPVPGVRCSLAIQDYLSAVINVAVGTDRFAWLPSQLHCVPAFGHCDEGGAIVHFAGPIKPWAPTGAQGAARKFIEEYNARFGAWRREAELL